MSVHSYLVTKHGLVPDLEKVVPSSMTIAVQKELESTRTYLYLLLYGMWKYSGPWFNRHCLFQPKMSDKSGVR